VIVRDLLQRSSAWLADKGSASARLDAELLLAHVLDTERIGLFTASDRPLEDGELDRYRGLLRRRAVGEPVAYLTGHREFYGLEFEVTSDVLVPRPETELLVDRARELKPKTLLDVGTGSGCVAVACAVRLPEADVSATDTSDAALAVARRNAERHGAGIRFSPADLFGTLGRFELIVSNPPYVPDGQAADIGRHEPHVALYAGPDGMEVLRRLISGAPAHLESGGTLLAEIGEDQEEAVRAEAESHFAHVTVHRDLAGHPRVLEAS